MFLLRFLGYIFAINLLLILIHDVFYYRRPKSQEQPIVEPPAAVASTEVDAWLHSNDLSGHAHLFHKNRITSLFQCSHPDGLPDLGNKEHQRKLELAARKLQKLLILKQWLRKNHWSHLQQPLERLNIRSLKRLSELNIDSEITNDFSHKLINEFKEAQQYLPPSDGIAQLELLVWSQIQEEFQFGKDSSGFWWIRMISCGFALVVLWYVWELGLTPTEVLWGVPLHKSFTKLEWPENLSATNTKTVKVAFYSVKGCPLDVSQSTSMLTVEVWHQQRAVNAFLAQGSDTNIIDLVFPARLAGQYYITLKCGPHVVRGFPSEAAVEAGEVDAVSTVLVGARSSTLVLTSVIPETIQIEPRDKFGNSIQKQRLAELAGRFRMKLLQRLGDSSTSVGEANFVVYHTPIMDCLCASLAFNVGQEGWYKAAVILDETAIGNTELTLIVLSREERACVNKLLLEHENLHSFEAELVAENNAFLSKPKSVLCSLTTKQLTIKEYFLRIFPRRLYTFRLIPATKVTLVRYSGFHRHPVMLFEDSFQGQPQLLMKEGNIMAATFHLMVLNKIGGSESFRDKQTFFNAKLLKHHQMKGHRHSRLNLKIDRTNIIYSSLKATRWFSEADWARLPEIEFEGEFGLDQGGLRREWFEILGKKLFHPSSGLFVSVEENSEAVFPNPNPSPEAKAKLYRFAGRIVGKCLYESAHGLTYRQHLPARLAKSFLVQLVGLRVHYRHFAYDAPELYSSKIRFIEKNSVEGLELTFTDEEYGRGGELLRMADLKPGGSKIQVTDANKMEYLDLLAQHRLAIRIKDQTESFLSGLNQFVPDSLLSLFDESELELLLCGVREYDLDELKKYHAIIHGGLSSRTIDWFWLALSSFSPEQFARLLQFTTGSSQLPPGGFSELKPNFQIASNTTVGNLPTAHTCFNMICLPEHSTFKKFEQALLTAINEGNEGFGFA